MALFVWEDKYSVGVKLMDDHHKRLFDLFNQLHDALGSRKSADVMGRITKDLLDYTIYHFGEEQKMLERIGYTSLAHHKSLHAKFIAEVQKYSDMVDEGQAIYAATKLFNTSMKWLLEHIMTIDKGYEDLANSKGFR